MGGCSGVFTTPTVVAATLSILFGNPSDKRFIVKDSLNIRVNGQSNDFAAGWGVVF